MVALNSDHLLDQAERLIEPALGGSARQVDLRRAISAAYYALFHSIMAFVADEVVGSTNNASPRYRLVYRRIDHRTLSTVCGDLAKAVPPTKYMPYLPSGGFGIDLRSCAEAIRGLQQRRHEADYDPGIIFTKADAKIAIESAREAIMLVGSSDEEERRTFLMLLLHPPR